MSRKSIEDFLRLSEDDIRQREEDLRKRIPTLPGTGYLEARLQEFKVQPWPFVIYLAYNVPQLLEQGLSSYQDYDGAENYQLILEKLREHYVLGKLLYKMSGGRNVIETTGEVVSRKV